MGWVAQPLKQITYHGEIFAMNAAGSLFMHCLGTFSDVSAADIGYTSDSMVCI